MLTNLGNVLHVQGRNGEAVETYRQALRLCEQFVDRVGESVAWVNIGEVLSVLGDLQKARRAYEQSLAICREIEAPRIAAYAVHGLARLAPVGGARRPGPRGVREGARHPQGGGPSAG